MQQAYMLDTNVFNALLDGEIALDAMAGRRLLVTGIQAGECRLTSDPVRRAALLKMIEVVDPEVCLAASFAFDIDGAGLGQANWNDGTGTFERMHTRLKELDKKPRRQELNQIRDVLIAETAIKLGATLVTNDGKLAEMVAEFGGQVMTTDQFQHAEEP